MAPSLLSPLSSVLPSLSANNLSSMPSRSGKAADMGAGADDDLASRLPVSRIDWADDAVAGPASPRRPKVTPRTSSAGRSSGSAHSACASQQQAQQAVHFPVPPSPSTPLASTSSATASGSVERTASGGSGVSTPTLSAQRLRASSAALSDLSSALKAQKIAAAAAERRRNSVVAAAGATAGPSAPRTPSEAADGGERSAAENKRARFLSLPSKRPSLPWLNGYTSSVRRALPLPRLPNAGVDIGEALGVDEAARTSSTGGNEPEERATSPPPSYEHARKAPAPQNGLASPLLLPASSAGDVDGGMLDGTPSARAGSTGQASATAESETDEEPEEQDAEYLTDLYITSLTHLLSALPADVAKALPERQREALLAALREAMGKVQPASTAVVRRADALGLQEAEPLAASRPTRHEHVHAHHVYHHAPPPVSLAAASASTLKELPAPPSPALEAGSATPSTTSRVTAKLAMPAFELLLSVTAASISLASRGAANLVDVSAAAASSSGRKCRCAEHLAPPSASSSAASSRPTSPRSAGKELALIEDDLKRASASAAAVAEQEEKKIKGKGLPSEWEGPLALARAAAGMMYAQMASASGKADAASAGNKEKQASSKHLSANAASNRSKSLPTSPRLGSSPDAEDGALVVRSDLASPATHQGSLPTLARALKRSPLPSALSSSLSLLSASASRLGVRERAADVALKGASSGLRYVREHELHLYAMRMLWEGMEECVKAIEAFREEEAWEGGRRLQG